MRFLLLAVGMVIGVAQVTGAKTYDVEEVTLVVSHRIYKNFHEEHTVKLGERFILSDGEYSAEATSFYPDFAINADTKEVISRSDELNNPAVRVVIYKNDEKVDEVWAFKGDGSPHYYRDSLLAFQLMDFKGFSVSPPSEGEVPRETGVEAEKGEETGSGKDSTDTTSPGELDQ